MVVIARLLALLLLLLGGLLLLRLATARRRRSPETEAAPADTRRDPRYAVARGAFDPFRPSTVVRC